MGRVIVSKLTAYSRAGRMYRSTGFSSPRTRLTGLTKLALLAVLAALFLDCFQTGATGADYGVTLYVDDFTSAVLLFVGAAAFVKTQRVPARSTWPLFILFGLVVLNLFRGIAAVGLRPAGNLARTLIYLIAPPLAAGLLHSQLRIDPKRLAKWLCGLGLAVALVAIGRWAGVIAMPPELLDKLREVPRTLPADYGMIVGQALLAAICLQIINGSSWSGTFITGILAIVTIVLQIRSVWAATLIGALWLVVRTARYSRQVRPQLACLVILGGCLFAVPETWRDKIGEVFATNVGEIYQEDSTWQWRVQGYTEATSRLFASDYLEVLVGPPAGKQFDSNASFASIHIHSRYFDTLAYYGILGTIALFAWLWLLAKRVMGWSDADRSRERDFRIGRAFLQSLLVSQLVYFIPYFGTIPQGVVLGLIWLAAPSPHRRSAPRIDHLHIDPQSFLVEYRSAASLAPEGSADSGGIA